MTENAAHLLSRRLSSYIPESCREPAFTIIVDAFKEFEHSVHGHCYNAILSKLNEIQSFQETLAEPLDNELLNKRGKIEYEEQIGDDTTRYSKRVNRYELDRDIEKYHATLCVNDKCDFCRPESLQHPIQTSSQSEYF